MRRQLRYAGIGAVAAAAGVGAAVAAGAAGGDAGVRACAVKTSGKIVARGADGCARGAIAITISGDAFKKARGGTLTINGVAFKKGSGKTLTINGVPFTKSRGGTLTINGVAFKKSSGGTLTINGVAFKGGSGKTLTINGIPFSGSGGGPAGPIGPIGPAGPAGAGAARSGPPVEVAGPVNAVLGADAVNLASAPLTVSDGTAHRVLLAGGFDADCGACPSPAQGVYDVIRDGGGALFTRRLPQFSAAAITSMSGAFSEVVDTPAVCGPCTFTLRLRAAGAGGAGGASTIAATAIRLAVVDLGPAAAG